MAAMTDRIRQRRKALGLTAAQVAKALGVSRATVYRYEAGQIEKLPARALEPLAALLQTTSGYLLNGEGEAAADPLTLATAMPAAADFSAYEAAAADAATGDASGRQIAVFTKAVGRMSKEDYQRLEAMARQMFRQYFDEDTGLKKDDQ